MKKIVYSAMAVLLAAGLLTGCGEEKGQEQELPLSQLDVDKYVTLGDYNNLSVSVAPAEVDQAQLEQLMMDVYSAYLTEDDEIKDRTVEVGDTVNIDYVGKLNGVAFAGGTDSGALLTIGGGRFIGGFEDGLIGVMPGETVDLELSFPDPYLNNPSLSGQPVVFTVTVNYIVNMRDEVIPRMEIEGVATVEEFRQFAYDYLYEIAQEDYMADLQSAIIEALVAQCKFEQLPEYMLKESRETLRINLQSAAADIGVTSEMLVSSFYNGMSIEDFLETYAAEGVKQNLAFQAVANKEGLNVDDDELQSLLEVYASSGGYLSVEAFLEDIPREDFRNYFMSENVIEFLMEKVQITE